MVATPDHPVWDPKQYNRFEAERDRPLLDLLTQVPADLDPREVWDLGCGTGAHAAMLARRWPGARVHGLDGSPDMIETARRKSSSVDWRVGDIAGWSPEAPADLILANASLHWLPDHPSLFPRLMAALNPGGVLMVQMPLGHDTPHHAILREVAGIGPWAQALADVDRKRPLLSPDAYYDLLAPEAQRVDTWTTTYLHVLEGEAPVLEWMRGAALRPYLTALEATPDLRNGFLVQLQAGLSQAYPRRPNGLTLLPFPRLFLVARRQTDFVDV